MGKILRASLAATAAAAIAVTAVPAAAHAGRISGGGCRTQTVSGVSVRACISFRGSENALLGDAYLTSLGGRSCVRLRLNFLINGVPRPTMTAEDFSRTGYYPAQRTSVTRNSATQTARTTVAVSECVGDGDLGSVSSLEQRW
jgi:hypothetical protein